MKFFNKMIFIGFMITTLTGFSQDIYKTERQWVDPLVISELDEEVTFFLEMWIGEPDSITLILDNFFEKIYHNGEIVNKIVLHDNGKDADKTANDGIFSIGGMWSDGILVANFPYSKGIYVDTIIFHKNESNIIDTNSSAEFYIRSIKTGDNPAITTIENVQYTDYCFNYIFKDAENYFEEHRKLLANEFYKVFPDDIETMFFTTFYEPSNNSAGAIGGYTEWNTKGIIFGNDEYGDNEEFGSSGPLESFVHYFKGNESNDGVTLHEIFHKWGVAFDPAFNLTSGAHYSNSLMTEVGAGMGAYNYTDIEELDNGLFKHISEPNSYGKYGSLDLYIAGYIHIDEVNWPIKVLVDPNYEYQDSDNNSVYSSENTIQLITKENWLNSMGERIPSYLETKRIHEVACISMSYDTLTPHEMRYWHEIAKNHQIDKNSGLEENTLFAKSTRGIATLDTRLTPLTTTSTDKKESKKTENFIIANPASIQLNFTKSVLNKGLTFRMYNSMGNLVLSKSVQPSVSIETLSSGVYYIFIDDQDQTGLLHQKVVLIN